MSDPEPQVAVVDVRAGNLGSVCKALRALGARPEVCSEPAALDRAERIVFPGVGAFAPAARRLEETGLDQALKAAVARGVPLLGICLGMQLLFEEGFEFGCSQGLGLLPGSVRRLDEGHDAGTPGFKVPHIGWNSLRALRDHPLLAAVPADSSVYFLHSFCAVVGDASDLVAVSDYGPVEVAAVVARGNVMGTQFHPEKSQAVGLHMLAAYLDCAAGDTAVNGRASPCS